MELIILSETFLTVLKILDLGLIQTLIDEFILFWLWFLQLVKM